MRYKSVIAVVLLSLCLAGSALAGEPQVFTAIYWIYGKVAVNPDKVNAEGRTVVFYKDDPVRAVAAVTAGVDGNYSLNIFMNQDIPINNLDTYYVAVMRGADNYGMNPVAVNFSGDDADRGYKVLDLALRVGEGPVGDTGWIRETTIDRVDGTTSVKISWAVDPTRPLKGIEIFRKAGEFNRQAADWGAAWKSLPGTDTAVTDDIPAGDNNAYYYRVVPAADDRGATPIFDETLNTRSVGRYVMNLVQGLSLISFPLEPQSAAVGDYLGKQALAGDKVETYINGPWPAATFNGSSWTGTIASIDIKRGYWYTATAPVRLVIVGRAVTAGQQIILNNGLTLIGNPFAATVPVAATGLSSVLAGGDKVETYTGGPWPSAYYNGTGWTGTLSSLEIGRGFWVTKAASGDQTWTYPLNY